MRFDEQLISRLRAKLDWKVDRDCIEMVLAVIQALREVEAEDRDWAHDAAMAATYDHYGSD